MVLLAKAKYPVPERYYNSGNVDILVGLVLVRIGSLTLIVLHSYILYAGFVDSAVVSSCYKYPPNLVKSGVIFLR